MSFCSPLPNWLHRDQRSHAQVLLAIQHGREQWFKHARIITHTKYGRGLTTRRKAIGSWKTWENNLVKNKRATGKEIIIGLQDHDHEKVKLDDRCYVVHPSCIESSWYLQNSLWACWWQHCCAAQWLQWEVKSKESWSGIIVSAEASATQVRCGSHKVLASGALSSTLNICEERFYPFLSSLLSGCSTL